MTAKLSLIVLAEPLSPLVFMRACFFLLSLLCGTATHSLDCVYMTVYMCIGSADRSVADADA